jgi:hypothetical protein
MGKGRIAISMYLEEMHMCQNIHNYTILIEMLHCPHDANAAFAVFAFGA